MYSREEAIKFSTEYFNGDELAASVFVDKYALKNEDAELLENTPDMMHRRLARELARIESKFPNPLSEEDIFNSIKNFKYIVPQGSPMAGIGNNEQVMSISNCFVIGSPEDSYGGIMKADEELAQLMKRRAGVGLDISNIRPKGTKTKNAAKTTDGIGVFMERFSNTCREVAQNGRRGAEMISISVHHPEVETFIKIKQDKKKVTGANISVKLTDDFMNAVKNDTVYEQRWPVNSKNPSIKRMVNARQIWNQIIESAWKSAEPGLLFWDNVEKNTPADIYENYKSISTNPCFVGDTNVFVKTTRISDRAIGYGGVRIDDMVKESANYQIYDGTQWVDNNNFRKTGVAQPIKKITLITGDTIRATDYHTFILKDGEKKLLNQLKIGDILKTIHITKEYQPIDVGERKQAEIIDICDDGVEDVYCTTVETTNSFCIKTDNHTILVGNCGEINLSPYDSCRLIAQNVLSFVINPYTKDAYFDWEAFDRYTQMAQRYMDDIVEIELEQINKIISKIENDPEPEDIKRRELTLWNNIKIACQNGRRTGLGITALGDAIAALGLVYGSQESIELTEKIYKALGLAAYKSSITMASERGSFKVFDYEKEKDHIFVSKIINELPEEYKESYSIQTLLK